MGDCWWWGQNVFDCVDRCAGLLLSHEGRLIHFDICSVRRCRPITPIRHVLSSRGYSTAFSLTSAIIYGNRSISKDTFWRSSYCS